MEAEAGGKGGAARDARLVAARAAAVGAVGEGPGRAVVAGGDDAALPVDEDAADGALHAVAAPRREGGQGHEVAVPARPEPVVVGQVELAQGRVEVGEGVRGVEEADRRAGHELQGAVDGGVELAVGFGDEGFEG